MYTGAEVSGEDDCARYTRFHVRTITRARKLGILFGFYRFFGVAMGGRGGDHSFTIPGEIGGKVARRVFFLVCGDFRRVDRIGLDFLRHIDLRERLPRPKWKSGKYGVGRFERMVGACSCLWSFESRKSCEFRFKVDKITNQVNRKLYARIRFPLVFPIIVYNFVQ